ncbi:MAG: ABC transporter permease subunit [Clostridia bacterium]|nr:ABC transporter permease subunit [Clostridia bacterium]MBR4459797.1 ABC transporter permease subunit [Clostridia bacterium]
MTAVWRKELRSYFLTPVAWVYMGVFLALSSLFFYIQILTKRSSELLTFISLISYLWMLLTPVLTMRLLAEERSRRTDQLLFTSPVSAASITLGKFLAAVTVLLATVVLTLTYVLVIGLYGRVYPGEMLTGYLGLILQGCAFVAIDLLISALVRTPVVAAVAAFGVNLALWMMDLFAETAPPWLGKILSFLSLYERTEPFMMGQLSFAGIFYDLSVAFIALILTVYALDRRRWKQGG